MTRPARIVAVADSLALPRDVDGAVVRWEETWPYLLEGLLRDRGVSAEVINAGRRARTADTLLPDFDEHVIFKRPAVVALQVGIVDCAPRVFSRREQAWLERLPARVRDLLVKRRSARRAEITARDPLGRVYTQPGPFEAAVRRFAEGCAAERVRVVVVPVVADLERMERKSPGYTGNVALYNTILRRLAGELGAAWIEPDGISGFCPDGYHLDATGGLEVARRVADRIEPWLRDPSVR